ncbi:MAG TPA: 5'-nucleotidase C-terminal domain-containing protein [Polyangiaceae bacterium]|jgi:5'-nucleotidase|nr:5'-nucleotidase C-terminal domain-containing protein [Polyangiaceae bacterium]
MRIRPLAAVLLLLAACAVGAPASRSVELRLIAFNDFHGHLESAASLAAAIGELRRGHAHVAIVASGDLIGASPMPSALYADEPTVKALSQAGLELSSVGNHEFDHGRKELLRLQGMAGFHWLAANVFDAATGKTLVPPYEIREYDGIRVAFVGAVLRATPQSIVASGVEGLEFRDEAASVNALVPSIRAAGAEAIVLLIHEGGHLPGRYDDPACPGFDGPIIDIVRRLDPAIDVVVGGHTHEAYSCRVGGRVVTSTSPYGHMATTIDLTLDRATHDITSAVAKLVAVDASRFPPDPAIAKLVDEYVERAAPVVRRVVGVVYDELAATPLPSGQSRLGRFVAQAQLEAMRGAGAQAAFVDPGGLRAPLRGKGTADEVTYGDLRDTQPFGNRLVAMSLTGAQLTRLLEQQWRGKRTSARPRLLSMSRGFEYQFDESQPVGHRVVPHSVKLEGRELDSRRAYRIVVNDFLASGGAGYKVLREGTDRETGPVDVEALERYVALPVAERETPAL